MFFCCGRGRVHASQLDRGGTGAVDAIHAAGGVTEPLTAPMMPHGVSTEPCKCSSNNGLRGKEGWGRRPFATRNGCYRLARGNADYDREEFFEGYWERDRGRFEHDHRLVRTRLRILLFLLNGIDLPVPPSLVVNTNPELSINCHNIGFGAAHPLRNLQNRQLGLCQEMLNFFDSFLRKGFSLRHAVFRYMSRNAILPPTTVLFQRKSFSSARCAVSPTIVSVKPVVTLVSKRDTNLACKCSETTLFVGRAGSLNSSRDKEPFKRQLEKSSGSEMSFTMDTPLE